MKCEKCAKKACLHVTEVLPEVEPKTLHFCEGCASDFFQTKKNDSPQAKASIPAQDDSTDSPVEDCDQCGATFREFRNTGKLGCPHEYQSFHGELMPLLESIHGNTQHLGKKPSRSQAQKQQADELAKLKRQMNLAITQEAYEEAARLRDRIRDLETGTPTQKMVTR